MNNNNFEFEIEKFIGPIDKYFRVWQEELKEELSEQAENIEKFANYILNCRTVFTCGKGRSEIISNHFGVRLIQAGWELQKVGDTHTRAIGLEKGEDVLLCISGSGETASVVNAARIVKQDIPQKHNVNVPILTITAKPDSELAKLSNVIIVVSGKTKHIEDYTRLQLAEREPIDYLGSEFEDKTLILTELLVNYLAKRKGKTEKEMKRRHANIE